MEEKMEIPIPYPEGEPFVKIAIKTPEESAYVVIVKKQKDMNIVTEAITMYEFLNNMRQPLRAAYEGPDDQSICSWCGRSAQQPSPVVHNENCPWTASREILERITNVD